MTTPATQPTESEFVTISRKEYNGLVERDAWLSYLEAAGVDNWEGYSHARSLQEENEGVSNKP